MNDPLAGASSMPPRFLHPIDDPTAGVREARRIVGACAQRRIPGLRQLHDITVRLAAERGELTERDRAVIASCAARIDTLTGWAAYA